MLIPASSAATAPANCFVGTRSSLTATFGPGLLETLDFPGDFMDFGGRATVFFFVFRDLEVGLSFPLFLSLVLAGFDFFGIAGWATYNVSPTRKFSCCFFLDYARLENDVTPAIVRSADSGPSAPTVRGSASLPLRRVSMWMCLGAL